MPARKTPEDYHQLAAARGLVWLGKAAPGTQRPTTWRCRDRHHVFARTYNRILTLRGCPLCSGRVRKTPDDYAALARLHGLTWLGPEVDTTRERTQWRCAAGHVFESRYSSIQQGSGCPRCSGKAAHTAADFHVLARARRLTWLGSEPVPTRIKTTWRCPRGHAFAATFNSVQSGHGCPQCAGNARRSAADFRRVGRSQGLTWLGPLPEQVRLATRWKCAQGHVWSAPLSTVLRGHGCLACRAPRRSTAAYEALARRRRLTWLGPLPETVLGRTRWRCQAGHEFETRYALLQRGSGCPRCSGHGARTTDDYRDLARLRKLKWLGPEVASTGDKTQWQCRRQHRFWATYNSVRGGHGCAVCAGNARKVAADYHALARLRNFKWIGSALPRAVSVKTTWACSLGHRWSARYNSIQQGSGCPTCARHGPAETAREVRRRAHAAKRRSGLTPA